MSSGCPRRRSGIWAIIGSMISFGTAFILSLIHVSYSWVLRLGRAGFITDLLSEIGIEIGSIYGFRGILLVGTLKLFPYVYMYVSTALKNFDSSLAEASESLGVYGFRRIWHVTLPVIMPTILSAALIVFMLSLIHI